MSIIEKLQQACTNFNNAIEKAEESLLKQDIAIKNSTVDRQHKINLRHLSVYMKMDYFFVTHSTICCLYCVEFNVTTR